MTDRAQFEAMLEALINDDQQAAKEIFHNIVVGKSREIYEELLAEDFDQPMEEEGEEEAAPMEEEAEEEGDDAPFGGDEEGDDEESDGEEGEESPFGDEEEGGDEEGEGGDIEDRVMDLEDALDELKAEFEQLMAGEEGEEHMGGDDMGGDMDIDMGSDDLEMEDELAPMMEYVDKVALPKHGDNGVNTKSAVAGKNDMGGTTANIAKSFSTEKGGTQGGLLAPSTKPQDGGNINKPGANAGKTAFKKKEPGHGAEKKGAGENADNKKSIIGGKK